VRPGGPCSCPDERGGGPGSTRGPLQLPWDGLFPPVFQQYGDRVGPVRSGHPDRLVSEQFLLHLRADPDQPGQPDSDPALHLQGSRRRRERRRLGDSGSGSAEGRPQRHRLSQEPGHAHTLLGHPHRNAADGCGFTVHSNNGPKPVVLRLLP